MWRRLLECLQQLVGGRGLELVGLGYHPHARCAGQGLEGDLRLDLLHLLQTDDVAFAGDHGQVRVGAVARALRAAFAGRRPARARRQRQAVADVATMVAASSSTKPALLYGSSPKRPPKSTASKPDSPTNR